MAAREYIEQLLSYEEYAFSWEELLENSSKSEVALKRELSRLVEKKEVINLRKGFYLILPPRYRSFGQLPIELYVEKFFKFLKKPYYVVFYTAAHFHGASHQQIQKDYVMTKIPAIWNIEKNSFKISFFTRSNWPKKNIVQKKSDAGYFQVSSPALTVTDLLHYQARLGGINRMLSTLEELTEDLQTTDLEDLLTWYPHKSALQRLGFLMDKFQFNKELTTLLYDHLNKQNFYSVLLSHQKGQKAGKTGNRWKVDVNLKLESDI